MIEPLSYLSAFFIGLLGTSHCLVMCGGISSALSMSTTNNRRLPKLLLFNGGRLISYGIAGFIVSSIGIWLSLTHINTALILRSISGVLLIFMGLYVARWWAGLTYLEKGGQLLWKILQPLTKKMLPIKHYYQALCLGLLWGWLPCGLIYSTLSWVSTQPSSFSGALTMMSFGLGTLPGMMTLGALSIHIQTFIKNKHVRSISALLLITYGLWTIIATWLPNA
jgi:sulfite exporter TauE/SafE